MGVRLDSVRYLAPAKYTPCHDDLLPFSLPAVARKKVTAAFDAVSISDGRYRLRVTLHERDIGAGRLRAR